MYEKGSGRNLVKRTFNNFKYNFQSVMFFEMTYKLLTLFIFIPINYFMLNKFMANVGVSNITNKDMMKFGFTYEGIFYMIMIILFSFADMFVEIGVLTYMAKKSHSQRKVSPLEGTINFFMITPKLTSIYMIWLILISAIIGPLTGVGLYNSFIRSLSIPAFIKLELSKSGWGEVIFVVAVISMIILLLRWVLAIPAMVIEDVSLKIAFKHSIRIYKKEKFKILGYIIIWVLVNFILKIFLLGGCLGIGLFFITSMEGRPALQEMLTNVSLIVFFIGYVCLSIITMPLFISFLVELYYKYRCYGVNERIFMPIKFFKSNKSYNMHINYNNKFTAVVLVVFIIVIGTMGFSTVFSNVVEKEVQITAHRGSDLKAPENSISAVIESITEGADYAEIDVMTTLDDEVVLFHDNTLKRIDGTSRSIKKLTLEEVKTIDIGSHFSLKFKDERIPTLEEVLNLARNNIKLNIELKPKKKDDKLAEIVTNMITEAGLEDQVVISSQSYESLQKVKEINPLIDVGFILTFGIGDFTKLNVDFISLEYGMLKEEFVYSMHALDKEVHVWTINDKQKAENAIKMGVDNIITDNVGLIERTQISLVEKDDVSYITRFLDGINAIIKYVRI